MECKISIIVPVYNSSPYLRSCIESILKQSLSGWELILVNDGSTDNSGEICDEYAGKYPAVRVFHKENAGVSAARNTGLAAATGEYVGFVDSDDTIRPEMYQEMYDAAMENDADIVMCDAVTVYPDGRMEKDTITQLPNSCILDDSSWTPDLLKDMAGATWRCIYRMKLIRSHAVSFITSLKFSEDRIFNFYLMGYASRLCYLKKAYYHRLIWDGSTVHRFHQDYYEHVQKAAEESANAITHAWRNKKSYQKIIMKQFVLGAIAAICNCFHRDSTLSIRARFLKIKKICSDCKLQTACNEFWREDRKIEWIRNKRILPLAVYAIFTNWRYRGE